MSLPSRLMEEESSRLDRSISLRIRPQPPERIAVDHCCSDIVSCISTAGLDTGKLSIAAQSLPPRCLSWPPFTLRGQANSKVSHLGGDCNANFLYPIGYGKYKDLARSRQGAGRWVHCWRPVCARRGHTAAVSSSTHRWRLQLARALTSPVTSGTSPSRQIASPLPVAISRCAARPTAALTPALWRHKCWAARWGRW
jgi:hypothetical protein